MTTDRKAAASAIDELLGGDQKRPEVRNDRRMFDGMNPLEYSTVKGATVNELALGRQPYTESDVLTAIGSAIAGIHRRKTKRQK